jgi:hypothetical protein
LASNAKLRRVSNQPDPEGSAGTRNRQAEKIGAADFDSRQEPLPLVPENESTATPGAIRQCASSTR